MDTTESARAEPTSTPAPATARDGLTEAEAQARLAQDGPNLIRQQRTTPAWRLMLRQFSGALVWMLLGACALAAVLGEVGDAIAIAAMLVLNALVGFIQEYRAQREVLALRSLTAPRARVRREGKDRVIAAQEVVRGDLLLLEAGDLVAADAHLLEAHQLATNEAALTGESVPVEKRTGQEPADAPLAERFAHVFLGTPVARGTGVAEVVATGMASELGQIAGMLSETVDEETPLQKRLEHTARGLLVLCLLMVVLVAVSSLLHGMGWLQVLLSSVSLAVAAVPEGLAAVVTIALAIGVRRMAARHVLVRRLQAVETLGSATIICTDKTGTLTEGRMALQDSWGPDVERLLDTAAACCDAQLQEGGPGVGDPTELAILEAAATRGIRREEIERARPRVSEQPFDSDRKRMSVLRSDGVLYVKGAVEVLLPLCESVPPGLAEAQAAMTTRGLRVLGVALGRGAEEKELELVGLLGLADPPRPEAIQALADARTAGVRTMMITGDHPTTALAIARQMGLVRPGEESAGLVQARATAADKLRIVRELKARGEIVAMTGDGVNDAPALKEAHVGVAMGKNGTEVTREAADLVLTDDNYASIVAAIREGRGVLANLRKVLLYLLSGNLGELLVMLGASMVGLPLPFVPLQLLWINLVTDGIPALALAADPVSPGILHRPPIRPGSPILDRMAWAGIGAIGALQAGVALALYAWALEAYGEASARALVFMEVIIAEVMRAFAVRSSSKTLWEVGALENRLLILAGAATVLIQVGLEELDFTRRLLDLAPLTLAQMALALGVGLVPVTLIELSKLARRLFPRGPARLPQTADS